MEQDPDSHQRRRLRGRGVPYGMLDPEVIVALSDGDVIAVDGERLTLWSRSHTPDSPQQIKRHPKVRPKPKPEPKLRAIGGAKKLMQETIKPHLETMAMHISAPLRLEIVIRSHGCKDSPWSVEFQPGSVTVVEGEASSVNVLLKVDIDVWPEFIKRKLSWKENMMKNSGATPATFERCSMRGTPRSIKTNNRHSRDLPEFDDWERIHVYGDFRTGSGLRAQAQPFGLGQLSRIAPPVPRR